MIDGMLISTFKGFPAPWNYLPIRPLTLVFGQNAAGKSSLLQAMAWMHHIHQGGNPDTNQLRLTGGQVNLGGFSKFKTRTDIYSDCSPLENCGESIGMGWGFQFKPPIQCSTNSAWLMSETMQGPPPPWYLLYEIDPSGIGGFNIISGSIPLQFSIIEGKAQFVCFQISTMLAVNNGGTPEKPNDQLINPALVRSYLLGIHPGSDPEAWTDEWCAEFSACIREALVGSTVGFNGLSPYLDLMDFSGISGPALAKDFLMNLQAAIIQIAIDINQFLSGLAYLGPWRKIPTLDDLANTREGHGVQELELWDQVRKDPGLRDELNQWLTRFSSNLRIDVRDLISRQHVLDLIEKARLKEFSAILGFDPTTSTPTYTQEDSKDAGWDTNFASLRDAVGALQAGQEGLVLRLAPSKVEISPANTGVGISQLVPIIVAALSRAKATWLVEQPELHLHPKAQAILGDLFIRGAVGSLGAGKTFIIETHSEHLILRLLRRVRETCQLFLKNEFPLHPDELAVAYVGRTDHEWLTEVITQIESKPEFAHLNTGNPEDREALKRIALEEIEKNTPYDENYARFIQISESKIFSIPVTENGDFAVKWPDGFFEERLDEMFSEDELARWLKDS